MRGTGLALLGSVVDPNDCAAKPGDVLAGKYVLGECIGVGGMGTVFLAEDPSLARDIAIKILHPHLASDAMFVHRFRDEAIAASRVQHRGAVAVIDFGVAAGGAPFIAMELVPGRPLGRILSEEVIPLRRALGIFDQILDVLDAAHACEIVHGDVKSDNFMVDQQARGDAVKLIDFGLAHLHGALSNPGFLAGTPEYMAPELVHGAPPTRASDLYGAGVILYEMLTGATPFAGGPTSEILRRQVEEAVIPPSLSRPDRDIPAVLDRIVLRALDKDPGARFASAQGLRVVLAGVAVGRGAPSRGAPSARRPLAAPARLEIAPPERRRIARGSDPGAVGDDGLRRAIASALVRGDVPGIADGYAALAAALAHARRLAAAIHELEEGIDVITAGQGPTAASSSEPASRLVASLAALYELSGEPRKARRTLACTDGRVTLVGATGASAA